MSLLVINTLPAATAQAAIDRLTVRSADRRVIHTEYLSEKELRMFQHFGRLVQKLFMGRMAKKMGCRDRLDARPYYKKK